jgi:hypothetical protein
VIFSHRHKIGFIHIPKAAGMSIRAALVEMFPGAWYDAPGDHMHMQGSLIRDTVLGSTAFAELRWFAVTRHPVHTIWSSYCRTRQLAADPNRRGYSAEYCDYLDRFLTYTSFGQYAREAWLRPDRHLRRGGLWHTYCCDESGQPLPVRPLRYDNLASDWQGLCSDWDLPHLALPQLNVSGATLDAIPPAVYAEILDYCHGDRDLFGYR